ncbi:MAG: glycoside hydrolase family 43 protein [Spirochaetes bacterium]|nr:glycoside hydrolase family 43 protein [Spirochaetota bacterium]MBN2771080.1 glycoside hydrolase family 43 protein [Spirochaetota bacterium]HRX14986.1 glycoside hydrolase family 43 protein [Spirochaetota bacterium]
MKSRELATHIYTADPSAHEFNGRLYVYPSHDRDIDVAYSDEGDEYLMEDYHVLSMDGPDAEVIDHGIALHVDDVQWASKQMWAPDAHEKNGKYYLYFPARDKENNFRIGVAVGDKPEGPFVPEKDYIKGSFSIDPCVFKDDDGSYYVGFGGLWGGQLEKWQTGSFVADAEGPKGDEPALCAKIAKLTGDMLQFDGGVHDIQVVDKDGKPLTAGDEERRYFEGPWIHKYNGKYYFSYSTGTTHCIVYATADNVMGPYTYQGVILTPVEGWTTHHSIVEFKGKWYLFYHDCERSKGINNKRSVKMAEITYNEDGTIQTLVPDESLIGKR